MIDIRHEPQAVDLDFMRWLGEHFIPFTIVFTKADKIKEKGVEKKVSDYLETLQEDWEELPQYFITSSENLLGRETLLSFIQEINESIPKF